MPILKRRVLTGILSLVLAFTLAACDDDGPDTTSPGDTTTTEPVGS